MKAVQIRPELDPKPLAQVKALVKQWARWRQSDRPADLGYSHKASHLHDLNRGPRALLDWSSELTLERLIMQDMRPELRRCLLCLYSVPARESEAREAGILIGKLHLSSQLDKYVWPASLDNSYSATGLGKRTVYAQANNALYWLEGRLMP